MLCKYFQNIPINTLTKAERNGNLLVIKAHKNLDRFPQRGVETKASHPYKSIMKQNKKALKLDELIHVASFAQMSEKNMWHKSLCFKCKQKWQPQYHCNSNRNGKQVNGNANVQVHMLWASELCPESKSVMLVQRSALENIMHSCPVLLKWHKRCLLSWKWKTLRHH